MPRPLFLNGIVAKVKEPINNKTIIVAAGIKSQGTQAAANLLTTQIELLCSFLDDKAKFPGGFPETFEKFEALSTSFGNF